MSISKTETGISLLGGALLGAAVMYMLDPDVGDRRRKALREKAGDALGTAGDKAGDLWGHARDLGADLVGRAGELSSHLAEHARGAASDAASSAASTAQSAWSGLSDSTSDARDAASHHLHGLRSRLASLGHDLVDRARHFGRHAADSASDAADRARESARSATHPLRHRLAHALDPDHVEGHPVGHAVGYTSTALGTLALGAAAMYFLDPQRGRQRRNYVAEQVGHIVRETGEACRRTGTHLANRFQGVAHQAASRVRPGHMVSGEQLVQRARSQVGHVLANPAQVQLMADANGALTLYGRVPASEVSILLSTVTSVRGVTQVINRLDVEDLVSSGTSGSASAPAANRPASSTTSPAPQL